MAEKESKPKKERKKLTDAEKAANKVQNQEGLLAVLTTAYLQTDEELRSTVLSKVKGKLPREFVNQKLEKNSFNKRIPNGKKFVEWLESKEVSRIGSVARTTTSAAEIPYRWKAHKAEEGTKTYDALVKLEKDFQSFLDSHESDLALISTNAKKLVKKNKETGKDENQFPNGVSFTSFFAKNSASE